MSTTLRRDDDAAEVIDADEGICWVLSQHFTEEDAPPKIIGVYFSTAPAVAAVERWQQKNDDCFITMDATPLNPSSPPDTITLWQAVWHSWFTHHGSVNPYCQLSQTAVPRTLFSSSQEQQLLRGEIVCSTAYSDRAVVWYCLDKDQLQEYLRAQEPDFVLV